ncbi:MAG: serine protease [Proteobacteria bacterium]|nr:serine protease [Pseudomonadota bacterium]
MATLPLLTNRAAHRAKRLCRAALTLLLLALIVPALAADAVGELHVAALARADDAVVGVRVTALDDAHSAETLGHERLGSGIVIGNDGLVLTIGYLILEADHVDLMLEGHRVVPARVIAYDQATGFGLLQALAPVRVTPAVLGSAATLRPNDTLLVASGGPAAEISLVRLVSARPFSGYWEYHIDSALFTAPPRSDHSGAALFNAHGELIGIGSLLLADARPPSHPDGEQLREPGNMFVPVDLLKPILAELRQRGSSTGSARAWVGVNCVEEDDGEVRIVKTNDDGPAAQAGLQPGDRIVRIDGASVRGLEAFYKSLWRGGAERDVKVEIERDGSERTLTVHAVDRMKTLIRPQGI